MSWTPRKKIHARGISTTGLRFTQGWSFKNVAYRRDFSVTSCGDAITIDVNQKIERHPTRERIDRESRPIDTDFSVKFHWYYRKECDHIFTWSALLYATEMNL